MATGDEKARYSYITIFHHYFSSPSFITIFPCCCLRY